MTDVFAYSIVSLLLLHAAWRLPAALRGQARERSLWGFFAALACAWLLRTELGRALVDRSGVTDLATLLKHLVTVAGLCVLLRYVTAVYQHAGSASRSRRAARTAVLVHRLATRASLATAAVMTLVFFFALNRAPAGSPYFLARHEGEVGLALYMGLFYLYVAAAALVCGQQWGAAARQARQRPLRAGLVLMAAAMGCAVLYAVLRTSYTVLVTVHPVSGTVTAAQETVTDSLLYACFFLWCLGVLAPATQAVLSRARATRALVRLYPLWRDLALTAPHVVLHQPNQKACGNQYTAGVLNAARDLFAHGGSAPLRLSRRVTEIHDAARELRRYADDDLYARAHRLALREGHAEREAEAAAGAYWLQAALTLAATAPQPAAASAGFLAGERESIAGEVPRLLRVSAIYARTDERTVSTLLHAAPADH